MIVWMALQPATTDQLIELIGAALAERFATHDDLANAVAPLATQAQLVTMQAQIQAQLATMQAQLATTQAQLATMQAQLIAQMQALLAPHNAPAIAAAAAATVKSIVASRTLNAHDRSGVNYAVVPRADGTPPPSWPDNFDRHALVSGPIGAVDLLLEDFDLPHGPPTASIERRNALALHIGTKRV